MLNLNSGAGRASLQPSVIDDLQSSPSNDGSVPLANIGRSWQNWPIRKMRSCHVVQPWC